MKFKVSSKVKGSLILKSIGRPVSAGTTVYIEGNNLYAGDVQGAIKSGLLQPLRPEEAKEIKEQIIDRTAEAVIVNRTERVVLIDGVPIRPNGSAIRDLTKLDIGAIRQAVERGLIQIITDVDEGIFDDDAPEKTTVTEEKTGIDILEDSTDNQHLSPKQKLAKLIQDIESPEVEDNPDDEEVSKAVVWDFRAQETKAPEVVPQAGQKLLYDENEESDIEMADAIDEAKSDIKMIDDANVEEKETSDDDEIQDITKKIANMQKKLAQKRASKKKNSKKKTAKKKDSKPITLKTIKEPESDIAVPIDSMGNPLDDNNTHLIDEFNASEVSFVDKEQAAAKKMADAQKKGFGTTISLDLD